MLLSFDVMLKTSTLTKTVNFADEFSRQRKELKIITDKGTQNANDIEWFIFEKEKRKKRKKARDITYMYTRTLIPFTVN